MELNLRAGCWIKFCTYLAKWYVPIITAVTFIALPVDRYNDRLLPLLRQFLLIPNKINTFMDRRANISASCFNQFYWDLISTCWFVSFYHSTANSNFKSLGSGTSGSAVCISVCLTSLNSWIFNSCEKWCLLTARLPLTLQPPDSDQYHSQHHWKSYI